MNRRILLIDADPGFFQTLSDSLSRYAFDVVNEADPDQAILLAGAEAPALLVVGVDEPDKLGFKVFQRCKKGGLAKVPIMLVTSSVSAESFAKHKTLKTHADQYLDKRDVTREDLLQKIDALITLGAPIVEESLDVPIEVDEIPMGDEGDMVLEEEVGADDVGGDFGEDPHSPHSISGAANLVEDAHPEPAASARRMESMVDADIEDAFGGLLGDDYVEPTAEPVEAAAEEPVVEAAAEPIAEEPIPEPVPEPEPIAVAEMIPDRAVPVEMEAVPERFASDTLPPPMHEDAEPSLIAMPVIDDVLEEAVPGAIHDGGLSAAEDDVNEFDNDSDQATRGPRDLAELEDSAVAQVPVALPLQTRFESSPAIALDEEDIQAVEDEVEVEVESAVPEPVPHVNVREREPEPEPTPPAPEPTRPRFIEASTGTNIGAAPAPVAADKPSRPSGVLNVVDLGLDRIAEDADRDQSGLHDRRELRKIHELERQITQLKAEVERTRATAESTTRPAGREGEFLKLRENLLNQSKDLQKAKDEIAARDRDLADVQERLRLAQQAKTTLEAKAAELEQRGAADTSRVAAVEARERALSAQLATAQQELAAKTLAADHAETVRAQLERDVANERALRASSSSDAERTLRVEREQMIARHQGELVSLRSEAASAQESALAALHAELAAAHAVALAAATDAGRREIAIEAEAAVTQLEQRQAVDLKRLEEEYAEALAEKAAEAQQVADEQAAALVRAAAERDAAIEKAQADRSAALAKLTAEHQAELGRLQSDLGGQVVAASTAHDRALAELRGEIARLQAAHDEAETQHVEELQVASANQAAALAEQAALHSAALAKREKESVAAREADAAAHAAALAELRAELERQSAAHGVKLEVAKREVDLMIEQHELAKTQLLEQQQRDAMALAAQHQAELAKVAEDKQRAIDDIQRASAEHRAAVEKVAAQHQGELTVQREAADRELAEFRTALQAAKKSIEDATAKHTAEREAADQAHAAAISELTGQHERALAVVNGEVVRIKAVGDAEHGRAMAAKEAEHKAALAAKEAEHQRAVAEITAERDELRKGLSSSRDAHKRTESELAAAVQTIADRNSELRSHAQAIAERDQRIAELRKEIETVETENASYQEQVLRAYQKIKTDEAMVARAKKAMAIALTVLDDQGQPKES